MKPKRNSTYYFTNFIDLTKKRRKEIYTRLKNKIRLNAMVFGSDIYTSHSRLSEPNRPIMFSQDYRFEMLGNHKHDVWAVTVETATKVFWNKVQERARLNVDNQFSDLGINRFPWPEDGKFNFKRLMAQIKENPSYDEFGGRTYKEMVQDAEDEIIANDPPAVFTSISVDFNHPRAICVNVVVDELILDEAVINRIVRELRDNGPAVSTSETAVARARLPVRSVLKQMEFEHAPGYMAGRQVLWSRKVLRKVSQIINESR